MPFASQIQHSFGRHDISGVKAHTGGSATRANEQMGSQAYASGDAVAFKGTPDLHTAAHEAAHTVQQKGGVQLKGGIGQSGDKYETHADAVADAVVQGKSAEGLLNLYSGNSPVQHKRTAALQHKIDTKSNLEKAGDEGGSDPGLYGQPGGLGESQAAAEVCVDGTAHAQALRNSIQGWAGRLSENKRGTQVDANTAVIGQLDTFIAANEAVDVAVNGFKGLFAHTQAEYGRLTAMAGPAMVGFGFGEPGDGSSGARTAEDQIDLAAGENPTARDPNASPSAELTERAETIANTTGPNGGENKVLKGAIEKVKNTEKAAELQATAVADASTNVTNQMGGLAGAFNQLNAAKARGTAKELHDQYASAVLKYEAQKKRVEGIAGVAKKLAGIAQSPNLAAAAGKVTGWVVDLAIEQVAAVVLGPPPDQEPETLAKHKDNEAAASAYNGAVQTYNSELGKVGEKLKAFSEAYKALELKKKEHKDQLKELGQQFDTADAKQKGKKLEPGETGTYETIAIFQGQADAFLVTAETTKQIGERDLTNSGSGTGGGLSPTTSAAKKAALARDGANLLVAWRISDRRAVKRVNDPDVTGEGGPQQQTDRVVTYIEAYLEEVPISLKGGSGIQGPTAPGADTSQKLQVEVDTQSALDELDGYVTQIKAFKQKLGSVLGLN